MKFRRRLYIVIHPKLVFKFETHTLLTNSEVFKSECCEFWNIFSECITVRIFEHVHKLSTSKEPNLLFVWFPGGSGKSLTEHGLNNTQFGAEQEVSTI